MKRIISLLLLFTLLLSLGITAAAAEQRIEARELYYRGISIYVNGAELIPRDVNGNATEPFIIEGTTYLPVRALAGALGLKVDWDGSTNTITLTSGADVNMGSGQAVRTRKIVGENVYYKNVKIILDGKELTPTDVTGKVVEPFLMDGSTYLPLRAVATALGLKVGWDETTNTVTLDTPLILREVLTQGSLVTETLYSRSPGTETAECYVDGSLVSTLRSSFDSAGNLVSAILTDALGGELYSESLSYDEAGRVSRILHTGTDGSWLRTHEYDAEGRLVRSDEYAGTEIAVHSTRSLYSYDEAGRLVRLYIHQPQGNSFDITFYYDDAGRLVREETDTTIVAGPPYSDSVTEYFYDHIGRLISQRSPALEYEYHYNAEGLYCGYTCTRWDGRVDSLVIEYQ